MSRVALALAGVVLLAGAAALHPAPAPAAGPLAALGRSLGGWRVAAVDVLALRADALRRQGRSDELVAVYEAMVGLDPGNAAATEALAALLVAEGLRVARSDDERLERWTDGMRLLQAGIAEHPASALLAMRAGLLLLEDAEATPGLAARVEARMGGVEGMSGRVGTGLSFLAAAAEAEEHLPRTGRAHLVALAREAPRRAAEALAQGARDEEVRALLAQAGVLRAVRRAACSEVEELTDPEPGYPGGRRVALLERLAAHEALLEAALAARAAGDRAALERALEAAEARAGVTATTRALRATLPR